jgi:hypothetical protein
VDATNFNVISRCLACASMHFPVMERTFRRLENSHDEMFCTSTEANEHRLDRPGWSGELQKIIQSSEQLTVKFPRTRIHAQGLRKDFQLQLRWTARHKSPDLFVVDLPNRLEAVASNSRRYQSARQTKAMRIALAEHLDHSGESNVAVVELVKERIYRW